MQVTRGSMARCTPGNVAGACSPGAPGAGDPNAQRALGRVLGSRAVRADAAWHDARALWHDLSATKPCW